MGQEHKVAVVTAGGGGIGRAIALELRDRGYDLALMSRSEACEETASEVGGLGFRGSVTEVDDLSKLVEATMKRFGRIDAVVCHTAHPPKGDLLALDDEAWHLGCMHGQCDSVRVVWVAVAPPCAALQS